jgi:tetratricopeptide (TPR) repeat protein/thiol-disulfide isomerase/thioredoxin
MRLGQRGGYKPAEQADERDRLKQLADSDARVFLLLGLHPGPDFGVAAAASLAGIDLEAARLVLDRLVQAFLVTKDAAGRFRMPDLLGLFARQTCREAAYQAARDAAEVRLVGYYVDLAGILGSCLDPRLRAVAAQVAERAGGSLLELREAQALFEAERPSLLAVVGLAAQRGWDEQVGRLSERTGDWFALLRYLSDLLSVRETALAAARHAGDTAAVGRALTNLGAAYELLRRFEEAVSCHQDALAVLRKSGDRPSEGITLNNLGSAYRELRRFEEAAGSYQDALAVFRETGDRLGEGLALTNLGAYADRGRFEQAAGSYQDALAIFRETGNRYREGQILAGLGSVYQDWRRFEEAAGCYRDALAVFRETGDRQGEGLALYYLGIVYRELRQLDQVARCWRDAAAAMRDAGDHEEAARLRRLAAKATARRVITACVAAASRLLASAASMLRTLRARSVERLAANAAVHRVIIASVTVAGRLWREGAVPGAVAAVTDGDFFSQVGWFSMPGAVFTTTSKRLVVVYFWSKWNIQSRLALVDVEKIAGQFAPVKVLKLDTSSNPDVPRSLGITSVPAVVIFRQGDDIDRVTVDPNLEINLKQKLEELTRCKERWQLNEWDEQLIEMYAAQPWVNHNQGFVDRYRRSLYWQPETDQAAVDAQRKAYVQFAAYLDRPETPDRWYKRFLTWFLADYLPGEHLDSTGAALSFYIPVIGDWAEFVLNMSEMAGLLRGEPEGLAAGARRILHLAAVVAVLIAGASWVADLTAGHRTMWWQPAILAGVSAIYVTYGARSGRALALLAGVVPASLAVLAANAALNGGYAEAAAELLILAAAWGLAAKKARNPWVRRGSRAAFAVQALISVLLGLVLLAVAAAS